MEDSYTPCTVQALQKVEIPSWDNWARVEELHVHVGDNESISV